MREVSGCAEDDQQAGVALGQGRLRKFLGFGWTSVLMLIALRLDLALGSAISSFRPANVVTTGLPIRCFGRGAS